MLVDLLARDAVPFQTLHNRYGALLELVRKLLGVVPNCDPYLEIWPPAFRTYNVMVPNLLNLPFLGWGWGRLDQRWGWRCTWPAGRLVAPTAPLTPAPSRSDAAPQSRK
jgi:hypothetical protein